MHRLIWGFAGRTYHTWKSHVTAHMLNPNFLRYCLYVCFMSQSTAMAMAKLSVHLTTLFPGQLEQEVNKYFMHILWFVTDNNPSWMNQGKGEWPQKLFHDQSPWKYGTCWQDWQSTGQYAYWPDQRSLLVLTSHYWSIGGWMVNWKKKGQCEVI